MYRVHTLVKSAEVVLSIKSPQVCLEELYTNIISTHADWRAQNTYNTRWFIRAQSTQVGLECPARGDGSSSLQSDNSDRFDRPLLIVARVVSTCRGEVDGRFPCAGRV